MKFTVFKIFFFVLVLASCNQSTVKQKIILKNPLAAPVKDFVYEINSPTLLQSISPLLKKGMIVLDGEKELPYQLIQKEGIPAFLLVEADFAPNEEKEITFDERATL